MSRSRLLLDVSVLISLVVAVAALWVALNPPAPPAVPPVPASGSRPPPPVPAVQVITYYPGMPASSVEKTITSRIERWVNQAPDCVRVESRSIAGVSIIRVYFRRGTELGDALTVVNQLALGTLPTLPPNTLPPVVLPFDPAVRMPLGLLTVESPNLDEAHLKDLARIDVRNMLGTLPECAAPVVVGGKDRTIMVELNPMKLEAHKLSPLDVVQAMKKANLMVTPGSVHFGKNQILLDTNVMVERIKELEDTPIRLKPEPPVFLRDIGHATDSYAPQAVRVRIDGRRAVFIPVYAQTAPKRVVADVAGLIPKIQQRLPKGTVLQFLTLASEAKLNGDTGLVTIHLRAPSELRLDASEKRVAQVEEFLRANVPAKERQAIVAELGVEVDWSAAYTQNAAEQDSTIYLQLSIDRSMNARDYAAKLRRLLHEDKKFADLHASFDADGEEAPLNVRIEGGSIEAAITLARTVRDRIMAVQGTADVQIVERQDSPYLSIEVDPKRAADVGLSAQDVVQQVLAAMNNGFRLTGDFWNDLKTGKHDAVKLRYFGDPQFKLEDILNVAAVGTNQPNPVKLADLAQIRRLNEPVEIDHVHLNRVIQVRANVEGRSVSEVAAEVDNMVQQLRVPEGMQVERVGKSD